MELHDERTDVFQPTGGLTSESLATLEMPHSNPAGADDDVWTSRVRTEPEQELVLSSSDSSLPTAHVSLEAFEIEHTAPLAHSLLDDFDTQDLPSAEPESQNLGQAVASAAASELRRRTGSKIPRPRRR